MIKWSYNNETVKSQQLNGLITTMRQLNNKL